MLSSEKRKSSAIIAVLGDLHGHLTLAFRLLRQWEIEHGEKIDFILQVGDLGCYPDPFNLDNTTKRFAERDPDELGFMNHYYYGSPESDAILGTRSTSRFRLDADLLFVKGNHEDFDFLIGLEGSNGIPIAVDQHERILYLRNGDCYEIYLGETVKAPVIGALGGVARNGRCSRNPCSPFYTGEEIESIRATEELLDILLTHDTTYGAIFDEAGSRDILKILHELQPVYHFCGHYHKYGREVTVDCETQSYQLNEVNFRNPRLLNPGCFGILRWQDRERNSFELVDESWMGKYTRFNYREL